MGRLGMRKDRQKPQTARSCFVRARRANVRTAKCRRGVAFALAREDQTASISPTSFIRLFDDASPERVPLSPTAHFIYFLFWISFGLGHTLLAGPKAKTALASTLGRSYRLIYNVTALTHIALVIYGGRYLLDEGARHLPMSDALKSSLTGAMTLGIITFILALTQYDLGRFAGLTQLFEQQNEDIEEPLHLHGLHRFVRHPLYTGVYLYLWGSVRTEFDLATTIWASIYLMIGSHFEERKLIKTYGDAYINYKARVPAVIPWRGRAI